MIIENRLFSLAPAGWVLTYVSRDHPEKEPIPREECGESVVVRADIHQGGTSWVCWLGVFRPPDRVDEHTFLLPQETESIRSCCSGTHGFTLAKVREHEGRVEIRLHEPDKGDTTLGDWRRLVPGVNVDSHITNAIRACLRIGFSKETVARSFNLPESHVWPGPGDDLLPLQRGSGAPVGELLPVPA